ncbi:MAG: hypothetical protein ACOYKE_15590, partial [Ferruginibacter sp.]
NTYIFPNSTDQPSLGSNGIYGCLSTTPNPVWYYMQVQNPGNMTINISQKSCTGAGLDVDFALWGPFNSLGAGCGGLTAANNISCSYSIAAVENAVINNAQAGQVYILLITNYSNQPGIITFSQTGGTANTGTTNCDIVTPTNLSTSNSGPVCIGDSVSLVANTLSCAVYSWTGPNGFTSSLRTPRVLPPAASGVYTYTCVASFGAASAATYSSSTQVVVNPRPQLGNDTTLNTCLTPTVNLTTVYNTLGLTTQWTFGGTPVANPTSVAVSGVYQLIATNESGCKDTALVTVGLGARPNLGADVTRAVCAGTIIDLTTIFTTTGLTTNWTLNGGAVANPAAVSTTGIYQLIATNTGGCADTALVNVTVAPKPNLGADVSQTICPGTTLDLTTIFNTTDLTTAWTFNGAPVATPAAVSTAGAYQLIVVNSSTCADTALVNLTIAPKPALGADINRVVCAGTFVNLTTLFNTTDLTSSWTLNGAQVTDPSSVSSPGTYQLVVFNSNECSDTALVTLTANNLSATASSINATCTASGTITVSA